MRRAVALVVVAGCGRVAFDPLGGDGGALPQPGADGRAPTDGSSTSTGTVAGDTCADPPVITIDSVPKTVPVTGSMVGLADDYPDFKAPFVGFTCSTGIDAVYRLNLAVTANVSFSTTGDFPGSIVVGSGCPVTTITQCGTFGSSQTVSMVPGTYYAIIERTSGGTSFDLTISAF